MEAASLRASSVPLKDQLDTSPSAPIAELATGTWNSIDVASYGNTGKRAGDHVRSQREIRRESLISRDLISSE